MTRFTKTKIALATAGVLLTGLSGTASAFTGGFGVPEPVYAQNLLGLANAVVSNTGTFAVDGTVSDLFFGRKQAFNIRLTLSGADFEATATPTISPALLTKGWVIGTSSIDPLDPNIMSVAVEPNPVPPPGGTVALSAEDLIQFTAGNLSVENVAGSLGIGQPVTMSGVFNDPVSGLILGTFTNAPVYTAAEATTTVVSTTGALTAPRIDVGSTGGAGGADASKTFISPDGTINNPTHDLFFHAGHVAVGLAGPRSAAGTAAVNYNNAGNFQFDGPATGVDSVNVTLMGDGSFASVNDVWLAPNGDTCNPRVSVSGAAPAVIAAAGTSLSTAITGAAGNDFEICMGFDGTTQIDDQNLSADAQLVLNEDDAVAADTMGLLDPAGVMGDLLPLQFNGDVVEIQFVNSQNNVTQRSRVRLSNTGGTNGIVTFTGIDDDGTASTGSSSLTLLAGESVIVKIGDIEDGTGVITTGAMGTPPKGSGKWRLTITAEFDGMEVTNFIRHDGNIIVDMTKTTVQ